MARTGKSLTELAAEIERRADAKRDFRAPVTKLTMEAEGGAPVLTLINGKRDQYPVTEYAHGQIAEYADIPMAYYRRMMADDPSLLATNVNRWLADKAQDRRLIRTLDGKARAFLSDRYRPLENEDLAEAILPVMLEANLLIVSAEITDRRLYIKAVDRSIERDVPTGKSMGDGGHTIFDTISPAIIVGNSEVGAGALSVEWGVWTRACTNLAAFGTKMRKAHTGARAPITDEVFALLTDETKKATDNAVWLQTRDMVRGAFNAAQFEAVAMRLGKAADDRIAPEAAIEVVERAGRKFGLLEGERKGVLARLIEGADLSRYGLHAAITRHSQDETIGYDRATELEGIGGDVIDLQPGQWKELAAA